MNIYFAFAWKLGAGLNELELFLLEFGANLAAVELADIIMLICKIYLYKFKEIVNIYLYD